MTTTATSSNALQRIARQREQQAEIRRGLELLHEPGDVFEIRALDVPSGRYKNTWSGYFNDFDKAAEAAAKLDARGGAGVYVTVNPVNAALLARTNNQVVERPKVTTGDEDVLRRKRLYIDLDPKRPSGIAATAEEQATAFQLAEEIEEKLRAMGWPYPLNESSGNGAAMFYKIDLPNDGESEQLIKRVYRGINSMLGTMDPSKPYSTLDPTASNAAKICRVPGTTNRKGAGTADRPHRVASMADPLEGCPVDLVTKSQLEAVAALAPPEGPSKNNKSTTATAGNGKATATTANGRSRLDVPAYLTARGVEFTVKAQPHGTAYLVQCPFDANHGRNGETAVFQADNGTLTFECKHASCAGRQWPDYRDAVGKPDNHHWDPPLGTGTRKNVATRTLDPGTKVKALDRDNVGEVVEDLGDSCRVHFVSPEGQHADKTLPKCELRTLDGIPVSSDPAIRIEVCGARDLLAKHPRLREPVIDGLARRGETVNIISTSKVGKSWLGYLLLLFIIIGRRWLDSFDCHRGRVLLIDNELHEETIARRLTTVAEAMGLADCDWQDGFDIISLRGQLVDLHGLSDTIHSIECGKYACVLADAFYRFLPCGVDENSNGDMAGLYNLIDNYADHLGAVWINIHHASKGSQADKAVTDVGAGAGSQSRAADSHLILRPHEQEGIAVMEAVVRSFPPVEPISLRWDYPLWLPAHGIDPKLLRRPQAAKRQEADEAAVRQIVAKLFTHQRGTARKLQEWTGISRDRLTRLLARMVESGELIREEVVVAGNSCGEFRIASPENEAPRVEDSQDDSLFGSQPEQGVGGF